MNIAKQIECILGKIKILFGLITSMNNNITILFEMVNNIVPSEPSYLVYTVNLRQAGATAPTSFVKENTTGEGPFNFVRTGPGEFYINNFMNAIDNVRFAVTFNLATDNSGTGVCTYQCNVWRNAGVNTLVLFTYKDGVKTDGLLDVTNNYSTMKVEVYPA